jgi:LysM repeat protein
LTLDKEPRSGGEALCGMTVGQWTLSRYWRLDWHVTPAEPDEVIETVTAPPEDAPPRVRRRWPWLALLLLVLAAMLGMALGVGVVLRGRSFGAQLPADQAARPTFVIAAPPSPSPSGSPRSSTTPVTATNAEEYTVVEAGDTLRSIAQQVYGDPAQWPRIYDANRETIGPDPDTLSAGTRLRIPRP